MDVIKKIMKSEREIIDKFCKLYRYPIGIEDKIIKKTLGYYLYNNNIRFGELCKEIKISFWDTINKIKIWTKK